MDWHNGTTVVTGSREVNDMRRCARQVTIPLISHEPSEATSMKFAYESQPSETETMARKCGARIGEEEPLIAQQKYSNHENNAHSPVV